MEAKDFFSQEEQALIVRAIKNAEKETSGEIRVHVENHCPPANVLDRASAVFDYLEMQETEERNAVLFYIAVKDHKFAILGDMGINMKVEDCCWSDINGYVLTHFQKGEYTRGLIEGIKMAGEQLKQFFPYQHDDINELPDDISFGN